MRKQDEVRLRREREQKDQRHKEYGIESGRDPCELDDMWHDSRGY